MMMLVISIVMGILPLFGIVWTFTTGTLETQDGLFMSLILLTLSGVFLLNAYWEMRDHGMLGFLHKPKAAAAPAKSTPAAATSSAAKAAPKAAEKEAALKSEG